jgi:hypothetical protein
LLEGVRVALPGFLLLQVEHSLDQRHHLVVLRHVGGIVEVDGADGELLSVLDQNFLKRILLQIKEAAPMIPSY